MNEQLQKSMAEILALLTESAKTVGATAQQEAPLLVQEYLAWGLWSNLSWGIFGFIAIGVLALVFKRYSSVWIDELEEGSMVLFFVGGVFGLYLTISTIRSLYIALQIAVAPRVYLLETVIEAIK